MPALATIAAVAATFAPVHAVTQCHIEPNGNANRCTVSGTRAAELSVTMPARSTLSVDGRHAYLYKPRVNGRRGRWNYDRTRVLWQGWQVQFDGVSFQNYTYHAVHITVRVKSWSSSSR